MEDHRIELFDGSIVLHEGYKEIRIDYYDEITIKSDAVIKLTKYQARELGEWLLKVSE